jgi:WD40 repeat protein
LESRWRINKNISRGKSEYRNLRWSKDGKYLVASSDKLMIHSSTGILVKKIKLGNENIWGVDWSSKGDKIIASDQGGNIWIIKKEGKILFQFKL